MRPGFLVLPVLVSLVACSAAPDPDVELARDDSEVKMASCEPAFEEIKQLMKFRGSSQYGSAVDDFLWEVGVERSGDTFVYVRPTAHEYIRAKAEHLKALLTGSYQRLSPLVDSISAKSVTQNLYGAPASALASSFHCLGLPSQSAALRDDALGFEEKSIKPTAKMRELFLHDGRDASIGWDDTVLELPYQLDDGYEVGIESVEEIRLSNKRVALRVTIGAPAIATDSCQQAEDETWPEECQRGTIAQKLYYNAELRRVTTMEEGAEFVAH